ncbi:NAD(P)-dependent dehydrogenase (short-subunit alcohol dehydrogenase family) [Shimia isoporae]|uniref:NAD(P)-dependent dehydrogenase (Short-subunit alcohol dehydrogenase family) n=1 Tax=Shimia isoporae TaxID=647720 RepID=A0A4R1N701_9RHOB|nr:SDR family oxidoreductase [Shimia isoporae]TCL00557.1 NAD(P)-dependent dehydrogenase (short-subunit alcohol dehydrogenase family) [Shimia isoporae]
MITTKHAGANYPSLMDRAVLVTGGGSGIGASIVARLSACGAKVGFVDIDENAGCGLVKALSQQGVRHTPVFGRCDITDIDAFKSAIADIVDETGPFTGLVNNAANDTRHEISEVTPESWRKALSVNLDHQFFAAQAVAQGMKTAGGGSIVNMGSMSWRVGIDRLSAYVSAKSAIEGLTNGLARELGPSRIRVNCITPGFVKTERQVQLWLTPELEAQVFESQCLPDFIEAEDVANLAAFLLADDSRMCTSGVFPVNGGWI